MDGPVKQLQLNVEAGFMYAITDISVSDSAVSVVCKILLHYNYKNS